MTYLQFQAFCTMAIDQTQKEILTFSKIFIHFYCKHEKYTNFKQSNLKKKMSLCDFFL